jgi:NAD dependent epimerase/dehydratase family enzyme
LAGRRINEARVTSEQRRNVMASRKLAQQRVLRIMQEQTSKQSDEAPIEHSAERNNIRSMQTVRPRQNKQKRGF